MGKHMVFCSRLLDDDEQAFDLELDIYFRSKISS